MQAAVCEVLHHFVRVVELRYGVEQILWRVANIVEWMLRYYFELISV